MNISEKKNYSNDVISSMLLTVSIAMIFTQLTGVLANVIDGIITSRAIGPDAYSSISLLFPFTGFLQLPAALITTGCQVICSQHVGLGEKKEANAVFSISIIMGLIISVIFILMCTFAPEIFFRICGVSVNSYPELYPYMLDYMNGYIIGIPAIIIIHIIGPIIVIDNGKSLFTISAFTLAIVDITGDLINAYVLHGGTYGMGLATSIAFIVQLFLLMSNFLKKSHYFSFSLSSFHIRQLKEILIAGSPDLVRKSAIVLRDLFVNRMNLAVALSTVAVAARGIQNDLNKMMFCIGLGLGKTLITMTGIYFSANDAEGLKRLFSYAMKAAFMIAGSTGVLIFLFAHQLAVFYTSDLEVIELAVFAIRCMAVGIVLDTIIVSFQEYLQGINNRRLVSILTFVERLFIPVFTAFILSFHFGSKGIMASIAVGKVILSLGLFIYICFRNKSFPTKWEDYMFLPKSFGGSKDDNIYSQFASMDDVMQEVPKAEEFCLAHGVEHKTAEIMSLFLEEMAGNIIQHGKTKWLKRISVDYRLYINDNSIVLILRDYCKKFDPTAYYEAHHSEDPEKMIGIRMVTKLAKEIRYFNAFNSNNIIILMDRDFQISNVEHIKLKEI